MDEEHKIIGMSPVGSIKRHLNLMQLRELAANQSDQITALRAEVERLRDWNIDLDAAPEGVWLQGLYAPNENAPWSCPIWSVRNETWLNRHKRMQNWYGNHHSSLTATDMPPPIAWRLMPDSDEWDDIIAALAQKEG